MKINNLNKKINLIKKLSILLTLKIKNISLNNLFIYLMNIINNKDLTIKSLLLIKRLHLVNKKVMIRNKNFWKFLFLIITFKVKNSKYYLEFFTKTKYSNIYLKKKFNNKYKFKTFTSNNNAFKSFNIKNNKLKQKLIFKKFWYLWKLQNIKNLKYKRIFLWPLIIIIKPYYMIIKNIYFNNSFILKKKMNTIQIKNIFKQSSSLNIGVNLWYIFNKYINYKINNIQPINKIYQNYIIFIKEQKKFLFIKNKLNLGKNNFFSMQKFYLKLRHTQYYGKLFFFKLYQLYLFWFLYFFNKLYYFYFKILFNIWIKIFYLNTYKYLNKKFYNYIILYKKNCINFNIKLENLKNKLYQYYNLFFKFLLVYNLNKDKNLLDLFNKEDYYKTRDYYKINYFLKKKIIYDFKYPEFLPKNKNLLLLN